MGNVEYLRLPLRWEVCVWALAATVTLPPSCGELFRVLQLALLFIASHTQELTDSSQAGAQRI